MDIGNIIGSIVGLATGGLSKQVMGIAKQFIGDPAQQHQFEIEMLAIEKDREVAILQETNKAQSVWQDFTSKMEGTASDLKVIPILGPIVIFLRGLQRPLWGFMVLWWDYKIYSGGWEQPPEGEMRTAFLVVNFLIISFLFGERAFKNIAPLIERLLGAKNNGS